MIHFSCTKARKTLKKIAPTQVCLAREENSPKKRKVEGSIQEWLHQMLGLKKPKTQPVRLFLPSQSQAARWPRGQVRVQSWWLWREWPQSTEWCDQRILARAQSWRQSSHPASSSCGGMELPSPHRTGARIKWSLGSQVFHLKHVRMDSKVPSDASSLD